jgi:hypothetical protein
MRRVALNTLCAPPGGTDIMRKGLEGGDAPRSIDAKRAKETATALRELLWALFLVNLFVLVAGFLVGRRLGNARVGVLAYLGVGLIASILILCSFCVNVICAKVLERHERGSSCD